MKEIMAIVRMNKTNATKQALVEVGAAGFTASKVMGRGKLVENTEDIAARQAQLMELAGNDEEAARLVTGFLDGTRLYPRRLFQIVAYDEEVEKIVKAIIKANRTDNKVGDGKIFVVPILDAVRVRTGEAGSEAI